MSLCFFLDIKIGLINDFYELFLGGFNGCGRTNKFEVVLFVINMTVIL
jgi:hypothetical protein